MYIYSKKFKWNVALAADKGQMGAGSVPPREHLFPWPATERWIIQNIMNFTIVQ